ncbi:MAG: metallophosphoesterase [Deltaproteobacteria bacterium]|nr:metallophosphoesterase [Deltaproteobacteria bacterium]
MRFFLITFFCIFLSYYGHADPNYFQFGVIGDTSIGQNEKVFVHFVAHLRKMGIKTFFHTGDVIHKPGSEAQWDRFLEIVGEEMEFHISLGNHDVNSAKSLMVYRNRIKKPPYYSFESGDAIFLILCTELPKEEAKIAGTQKSWLVEKLKKNYNYKFVFLHRPLFPTIFGKSFCLDRFPEERDSLHKLFSENGITCVFSGHEHIYNRTKRDGVTYLTTGGGGSRLLVPVEEYGGFHHYLLAKRSKDGYIFSVFDLKGRIRDEFMIKK